jgi:SAM-dependent methyltransferase
MDRDAWDERYAGAELVWSGEPNHFLAAEAADLPPGRVLDLACGEGRNAVWLAERGWAAVGVDFSSVGLRKGRELAAARDVAVGWVQADATRLPIRAASFDLVVVLYLHLPAATRTAAFSAAARAVAPGGSVLIVGHDSSNLASGWGGPQDPTVLYGPDDVVADLAAVADLMVAKAETVQRPVDTPDGTKVALDVLVRAARA